MAYKRIGHLTVVTEWCKHMEKWYQRSYWKSERKAGKQLIRKELKEIYEKR
jgi:hypothetical protein